MAGPADQSAGFPAPGRGPVAPGRDVGVAGGHWLPRGCSAALTLLAPFWAAFPRIYGLAGLLLALGVATRLVPVLERRAAGFRRLVRLSFPVLAGLVRDPGGIALGMRPDQGVARGVAAAAAAGFPERPPDRPGHRRRRPSEPLRLQPSHQPDDRRAGGARIRFDARRRPRRGRCRRMRACLPDDGLMSFPPAGSPRSMPPIPRWPNSWGREATPRRASSPTNRIARPTPGWPAVSPSIAITSSPRSTAFHMAVLVNRPVDGLPGGRAIPGGSAGSRHLPTPRRNASGGCSRPIAKKRTMVNREFLDWLSLAPAAGAAVLRLPEFFRRPLSLSAPQDWGSTGSGPSRATSARST